VKKGSAAETQKLDGVRLSTGADKTHIADAASCQIISETIFLNRATADGYPRNGRRLKRRFRDARENDDSRKAPPDVNANASLQC
jgi:hypothetical protein